MKKKINEINDVFEDIVEEFVGKVEVVKNQEKSEDCVVFNSNPEEPLINETPTELNEEELWEATIKSLNSNLKYTWIAVPELNEDNKIVLRNAELEECSPELFFKWVEYIYPQSKNYKHSPKDYEKLKAREDTFIRIITALITYNHPKSYGLLDGKSRKDNQLKD